MAYRKSRKWRKNQKKYYRHRRKSKYKKGVPKNFVHNWSYRGHWKERKVAPKTWKGRFRATKSSKSSTYQTDFRFTKKLVRANMRSGKHAPREGSKLLWYIQGYQSAVKTRAKKRY